MKQHLFIFLFFTGIVPLVLSVHHRYYLIQLGKTWSDAQVYCRTHHTDLAIIQSKDDMVQLQDEIQKQKFSSSAWIGLYREIISWYWSMGHEPLGSMTKWYPNEPNNKNGNELCVVTRSDGWLDVPCSLLFPVVCFDDTKTGDQRYIYISNTMTWHQAQMYCRKNYTDLASARDATEDLVIKGLTSGNTWFGLTTESWKWINQTTFSTISWLSGEPNSPTVETTCGYLSNSQAGDALCSDIMPFFCYSGIKQQIMRMEVRSGKDVNDPTVMDVIIKQIQQKLEECGLVGTVTMKWRVQPHRKVFHKNKKEE